VVVLNIQTMVLCVILGGKKWMLGKGKIIQEILRISKIPFKGYLIRGNIKKSAKYDFFFSKNLLRNSSLILGEKKRGKDFRLFFSIYLRSRTVLGNLTGKNRFFFRQISRQSCENDFHSSTISVDPLELKLFVKNCHVTKSSLSHTYSHIQTCHTV